MQSIVEVGGEITSPGDEVFKILSFMSIFQFC